MGLLLLPGVAFERSAPPRSSIAATAARVNPDAKRPTAPWLRLRASARHSLGLDALVVLTAQTMTCRGTRGCADWWSKAYEEERAHAVRREWYHRLRGSRERRRGRRGQGFPVRRSDVETPLGGGQRRRLAGGTSRGVPPSFSDCAARAPAEAKAPDDEPRRDAYARRRSYPGADRSGPPRSPGQSGDAGHGRAPLRLLRLGPLLGGVALWRRRLGQCGIEDRRGRGAADGGGANPASRRRRPSARRDRVQGLCRSRRGWRHRSCREPACRRFQLGHPLSRHRDAQLVAGQDRAALALRGEGRRLVWRTGQYECHPRPGQVRTGLGPAGDDRQAQRGRAPSPFRVARLRPAGGRLRISRALKAARPAFFVRRETGVLPNALWLRRETGVLPIAARLA